MAVTYSTRAGYSGVTGTIAYGPNSLTFNIGAALTAGGGSFVVNDQDLAQQLDKYPALYRSADDGQPLATTIQQRWQAVSVGSALATSDIALEVRRTGEQYARWQVLADGSEKVGTGAVAPTSVSSPAQIERRLNNAPINVADPAYGAVGDARKVTVTVGAGSTALTGTGFTTADNGKKISIAGAGVAGANLITTVTYVSATALTLGTAATGAVAGVTAAIGTDDTAAIQAAINAAFSAKTIEFPKPPGPIGFAYLVTAPLTTTQPGFVFRGDSEHGAQIWCAHTGELFRNGTDNGHAYDANEYNGPESVRFEHLLLVAVPAGTALSNGTANYSPGTYAIRDWRGGDIQCEDVRIEGFDFPFWGIQSDLNSWHNVTVINSKSGVYCGPRSDQWRCDGTVYFIFNDRAIDIDGAYGANFNGTIFVDNGSASINPIRIRSQWTRGSRGIVFDNCWFEHLLGAAVVEAFVEVGVGDTVASDAVRFNNPFIFTGNAASANHVQYLCKTGKCDNIIVDELAGMDNGALIDALFLHVDTVATPRIHIRLRRESATTNTLARAVLGAGAATPQVLREDRGNVFGFADGAVGRAQVQIAPNGNFPQFNWTQTNGTQVWTQQVGLSNSQMLLISRLTNGEFHVQDSSGGDQLKIADNATAGNRFASLGNATGKVGFYGATGAVKPTVTGSRAGNAALASLLTQLASLGILTDSSTA